jgi:cytochrome c oxidase cbb3-type subunit 3/ubiquinol-cytochrome c reductase cytochrome c subunit
MAGYGREVGGPLEPGDVNALVAFLRQGGPPPADLGHGAVRGDATQGKLVYATYCARCHGTPTQRSSAVHLANPILLETASDLFLRFAVLSGRPPTSMVSWRQALSPQQIDDVSTYVRSMARPAAPPVPAGQQALLPPPRPTPTSASTSASAQRPTSGRVVLNPKGRAPDFVLKEDRFVSIDQVKQALDGKRRLVIADARAPSDWLNLHIAGAISTPYYDATALDQIPNDGTWVLAYCACPHHVSGEVVDQLRKRGYKHTAVIDEGIFAWQQKGYPVVAAPGMAPIPAPPRPSPVPPSPPPSR